MYRFGIVGAGMIADFHAQAINAIPNAELTGIYSRSIDKANAFAQKRNCTPFDDYTAFINSPNIDIVTICTPSGFHLEPISAAAKAGKHIICEKPLEVTAERVDEMIAACTEYNVMLAGIFPRRFNVSSQLLKKALQQGRFGKIAMADAYIKWWRTQEYYESGAWRGTWKLDGGGALTNQSIHTIDLLLYVMGDVKSVRAETRLVAHKGIEVEDVGIAMLEFENGALGVIQGSTACWSKSGHPAEIQITGSQGSVFMSDDKFRVWEFANETAYDDEIRQQYGLSENEAGAGAADPSAIDFVWHQRNFEDVLHALENHTQPLVGGFEGRRSIALLNAIYRSAAKGGEKEFV